MSVRSTAEARQPRAATAERSYGAASRTPAQACAHRDPRGERLALVVIDVRAEPGQRETRRTRRHRTDGLAAQDVLLVGVEPAGRERGEHLLLAEQLALEHVLQGDGQVGRLAQPPRLRAEAERQHAEGVAEVAEQVVDPRVIVGDRVQAALVERTAGGEGGDDERVHQLVVAADLRSEAAEPAVQRLVPPAVGGLHGLQGGAQLGGAGHEGPAHERDRLDCGSGTGLGGQLVHGALPRRR